MPSFRNFLFILICLSGLVSRPSLAGDLPLPTVPTVPDSLGVNIHFTHPQPGEMEMLAESGVKWVRMDLIWEATEKERGVYDFSGYDHLVGELDKYSIKALFILDYGNPLYDQGRAPYTEEGREAFARWAVAAAKRYAGKGYLWEVWNEPNSSKFWRPRSKTKDYVSLALAVGRHFREKAPRETLVGPAVSKFDLGFLKKCFKGGLLDYWGAVTVHPYRHFLPPETAQSDYARLRNRIKKWSPPGREIPILSGEWGYSTAQIWVDKEKQGKFLARMWLLNLMEGIPLSIWYDWRDDGSDPGEKEHNYGMVQHSRRKEGTPPFEPKYAFLAARTLTTQLNGFEFKRRIPQRSPQDYFLKFHKGAEQAWAVWTSSPRSHVVTLPLNPGRYKVVGYLGNTQEIKTAAQNGLQLKIKDGPQYLLPLD